MIPPPPRLPTEPDWYRAHRERTEGLWPWLMGTFAVVVLTGIAVFATAVFSLVG